MDRTRGIFIAIVGMAFMVICGAVAFGAFKDLTNDSTSGNNGNDPEPPKDALVITLDSSSTKRNWLDQTTADFNASSQTTSSGTPIFVQVSHVTSGGSMNSILDGSSQPIAWSPGDQSWVEQANDAWDQQHNKPIASEACAPTVYAPLGFAMWRPMAETLGWPDTPIGWETIVELAADPEGWGKYGRPEWGQFSFGHTHPAYANSGLLSMTGFVYGIGGETITPADIYSDEVQEAMRLLQQNTSKYGKSAPALLDLMAKEGPSYLHAAAVPEADVVKFNIERGDELAFPLAFIFPAGGTIWADHPYCILDNADWVSDEEAEAAAIFRDYLLEKTQQELAAANYLRPLDRGLPLGDLLTLENGTDPRVSPETIAPLPSPSKEVGTAVIDVFQINKRKATVLLVLDVSGSMDGEKIKTARGATAEFLGRLDANDEVGVVIFSDLVTPLQKPARAGAIQEELSVRVQGLLANGNTALYDAVCQSVITLTQMQEEDLANDESRLYGIILLSDGEDTAGSPTENQMFATCLPTNAETDGIKIFPIAFGEGADTGVLERIANVTGGRMFTADPASISDIYISISAEQ